MTPPAHMNSVEACPEPLTMDMACGAVAVIACKNDFGARGGIVDRAGVDYSMIQNAVGPKIATWAKNYSASPIRLRHTNRRRHYGIVIIHDSSPAAGGWRAGCPNRRWRSARRLQVWHRGVPWRALRG